LSLAIALIAVVLFAGLFSLMQRAATPSGPRKTIEETVFERFINKGWNAGDTTVLADLVTTNVVLHTPGLGDAAGLDAMGGIIGSFRAVYPDAQFRILSSTAHNGQVEARLTISTTQTETLNLPSGLTLVSQGETLTFDLVMKARINGQRIAELWVQPDGPTLWLLMTVLPDEAAMEVKDQHVARAFALDALLDQGDHAGPQVPTLLDPALVIHDTARDGTLHNYDFADVSSGAVGRGPLLDDGVSVEHIVARGDLVAVRVLVQEDAPTAPHWSEWITLYRFDEEGRIAEGWRFWHRTYADIP
jgi:hypothetical protein